MGCSLHLWVGTAAEDRAFHSDSTYKPRDTETAFDDMSCAGETWTPLILEDHWTVCVLIALSPVTGHCAAACLWSRLRFFWPWNTTAFPFLSCYFSVLIWPLYSHIIVYLYAWLLFCFISFWDKVVLFLSNHTSILRKVIYPPSLSSQKDSVHFVTGRATEMWRWFMWLHHLGKNQATFLKSNQGNKRLVGWLGWCLG